MSDHAIALAGLIAGAVGALAAAIALIYAHRAHRESVEANDIADEASKLARNANEIAAREEARETEPHDVFWEGDWDPLQPGRYSLRKRGDAAAINVRAQVSYSGEKQTASSECMSIDGATLTFRFDRAARLPTRVLAARQRGQQPFPRRHRERRSAAISRGAGRMADTAGHPKTAQKYQLHKLLDVFPQLVAHRALQLLSHRSIRKHTKPLVA